MKCAAELEGLRVSLGSFLDKYDVKLFSSEEQEKARAELAGISNRIQELKKTIPLTCRAEVDARTGIESDRNQISVSTAS